VNLVESKIGDVCVIAIEGDVDAGTAPDLEHRLHELMQSAERKLVLDLAAVPYVSSAFLGVVLTTARDIRQRRGDLRLANLQPSVRAVFDLAGFSELFSSALENAPARIAEALAIIGYQPQKDVIFIKPNVPDYGPPNQGLYTDPRVVEGLLQALAGRPVVIGEGGIVGRDTMRAFQRTGYAELARRYGAELVDLNEVERVEVAWEFGTLKLPALLRTHEYINVAKMKTHVQTGVTLGFAGRQARLSPPWPRRLHPCPGAGGAAGVDGD